MNERETTGSQDQFQQLVGSIFDAAWNPEQWTIFLKDLGESVGSVCTTLYYHDSESQKGSLSVAIDLKPKGQHLHTSITHRRAHKKDLFSEDARLSGYVVRPGQVVIRTDFYDHWLLGALVVRQDNVKANLVCLRPESAGPFGAKEHALLERLVPYLRRAILLHRRLRSVRVLEEAAFQLLNHLTLAVILVDCDGRILSVNTKAKGILAKSDGLSILENKIRTARREESKRLLDVVKRVAPCQIKTEKLPVHAIRISKSSMGEPYSLLASALTTDLQLTQNECIVALFIHDPEEEISASEQTLRELYGLTPAESRLVSYLLKGKTLEEAAEVAETSMSTVRTQIRSVFAKTNTNRQADLIRMLLRSPAVQKQ